MPERFKGEVRRIVRGSVRLAIERRDNPASHGWLRRPEFDGEGVQGWEKPDGTVVGIETPAPPAQDAGGPPPD